MGKVHLAGANNESRGRAGRPASPSASMADMWRATIDLLGDKLNNWSCRQPSLGNNSRFKRDFQNMSTGEGPIGGKLREVRTYTLPAMLLSLAAPQADIAQRYPTSRRNDYITLAPHMCRLLPNEPLGDPTARHMPALGPDVCGHRPGLDASHVCGRRRRHKRALIEGRRRCNNHVIVGGVVKLLLLLILDSAALPLPRPLLSRTRRRNGLRLRLHMLLLGGRCASRGSGRRCWARHSLIFAFALRLMTDLTLQRSLLRCDEGGRSRAADHLQGRHAGGHPSQ